MHIPPAKRLQAGSLGGKAVPSTGQRPLCSRLRSFSFVVLKKALDQCIRDHPDAPTLTLDQSPGLAAQFQHFMLGPGEPKQRPSPDSLLATVVRVPAG